MASTDRRESVVDGGFAHTATGFILAIGIMRGVEQAEALADPRLKVLPVTLKWHVAPDIHFPQIHRRSAVANPLGGDLAHTPG